MNVKLTSLANTDFKSVQFVATTDVNEQSGLQDSRSVTFSAVIASILLVQILFVHKVIAAAGRCSARITQSGPRPRGV